MSVVLHLQPCPACGAPTLTRYIDQSAPGNQLRWHVSEECASCDYETEIEGVDAIESPYRDAVYAETGIWTLAFDWPKLSAPQFLQIVRLLALPAGDFIRMRAMHPAGLGEFTAFEAQHYHARLALAGIVAQIVPFTGPETR